MWCAARLWSMRELSTQEFTKSLATLCEDIKQKEGIETAILSVCFVDFILIAHDNDGRIAGDTRDTYRQSVEYQWYGWNLFSFFRIALPENSSAIYESLCNVINRYRLICYFKVWSIHLRLRVLEKRKMLPIFKIRSLNFFRQPLESQSQYVRGIGCVLQMFQMRKKILLLTFLRINKTIW